MGKSSCNTSPASSHYTVRTWTDAAVWTTDAGEEDMDFCAIYMAKLTIKEIRDPTKMSLPHKAMV